MSEMIEKASAAIALVLKDCGIGSGEPWARSDEMARAAIEAIREPTQIQNHVGNRYVNAHPDSGIGGQMWMAMIDAGLHSRRLKS